MIDKNYCMSSFLAFRYVANEDYTFGEGLENKRFFYPTGDDKCIKCDTPEEIEQAISKLLGDIDLSNAALLLSGGIDSGILASYMPAGTVAYTANAPTKYAQLEIDRAKAVCDMFNLEHRIVEVTWEDYESCIDDLMRHDNCPVFANEPQVYMLAKRIKEDGFDTIIFGDNADMAFGGYDGLLSKDWDFDGFVKRFTFLDASKVLKEPVSVMDIYERYRTGENEIDYLKFMNEIFSSSSSGAYVNAFDLCGIKYFDPYSVMKMGKPFDFYQIRHGNSKYLLRELYRKRLNGKEPPEKIAMPRAVDKWLENWQGPQRDEFIKDCHNGLTGEQKFLLYSLERFLNIMDL